MDFTTFLTYALNEYEGDRLTPAQTAELLTSAAVSTVEYATKGYTMTDTLDMQQLGTILVALQWTVNPTIQQAVKVR